MANYKGTVSDKLLAISDKPTIRAFIALELNKQTQAKLAEIQEVLKKSGASIRWVNQENIHLTLKFLGQVTFKQIEQLKKLLEKKAKTRKP